MFPMRLMRQQLAKKTTPSFLRASLKNDTPFLQKRNLLLKKRLDEFQDFAKEGGPVGRAVLFGSTGALFFGTVSGLYTFGKTLKVRVLKIQLKMDGEILKMVLNWEG